VSKYITKNKEIYTAKRMKPLTIKGYKAPGLVANVCDDIKIN
jgi:hypothetical protein